MNIINRALSTLILLVLLGAALAVLVLHARLIRPSVIAYGPLHRLAQDLASGSESNALVVMLVAIALVILTLVALYAEMRPRRVRGLRIYEEQSANYIEVPLRTLVDAVAIYARDLKGVSSVRRIRVSVARGVLSVSCHAILNRFADEAGTTTLIQQTVSTHLQHFTGFPVQRVRVNVSSEAESRTRVGVRPSVR